MAAVHLALACQRASGSTISTDLKNNIQMSILLGGFDEGSSTNVAEFHWTLLLSGVALAANGRSKISIIGWVLQQLPIRNPYDETAS